MSAVSGEGCGGRREAQHPHRACTLSHPCHPCLSIHPGCAPTATALQSYQNWLLWEVTDEAKRWYLASLKYSNKSKFTPNKIATLHDLYLIRHKNIMHLVFILDLNETREQEMAPIFQSSVGFVCIWLGTSGFTEFKNNPGPFITELAAVCGVPMIGWKTV